MGKLVSEYLFDSKNKSDSNDYAFQNSTNKEVNMSMFCFQCQETVKGQGCEIKGMCGKNSETANTQDLLVYVLRGISIYYEEAKRLDIDTGETGSFILSGLFTTVTNVNFDAANVASLVTESLGVRDNLSALIEKKNPGFRASGLHDSALWTESASAYESKASQIGVMATENEDVRSLRELLVYGLKGLAAYANHAEVLGAVDPSIHDFAATALVSTTKDLSVEDMIALVMKAGEFSVTAMALLDKANTETYGNPEITEVSLATGDKPGILVSGHDLKDIEFLLEQTRGTGVDVYTHGEMLPTHAYPKFKKYDNLVGNYGTAWYNQNKDFVAFNGPILMTTNCITPVKKSYEDRIYTTGVVAYPGLQHIHEDSDGKKDFSAIIEQAKNCAAPVQLEEGKVVIGFAHNQVLALADKVVDAVKSGAIKRFVVMAGCDGRRKERGYFTEVAKKLPKDAVILTAGCAKYRYNKLDLGDIGGIPRVLDAGQCNDSYSLAVIALKLKEVFGLEDINELPISFDIAWYEQKAVAVLLALLSLGIKGIRLGPSLPAFLSPNVAKVLIDNFDIKLTGEVDSDVDMIMAGN